MFGPDGLHFLHLLAAERPRARIPYGQHTLVPVALYGGGHVAVLGIWISGCHVAALVIRTRLPYGESLTTNPDVPCVVLCVYYQPRNHDLGLSVSAFDD